MRIAFYTDIMSPHQLPLAKAIVSIVGEASYRYIHTQEMSHGRMKLGWHGYDARAWTILKSSSPIIANEWLENSDVLISEIRDIELFKRRMASCKKTIYVSERWLKPFHGLPGIIKLCSPNHFWYMMSITNLLKSERFCYFPQGIHAAQDMARLCGLFAGDLRCLFRTPKLKFESAPGSRIRLKGGVDDKKYGLDKMRMWGYFVEPSKFTGESSQAEVENNNSKPQPQTSNLKTLRVLWVGRLLKWKCVDTIIRAAGELSNSNFNLQISLDIYGTGPEENRLKNLAAKYGDVVNLHPPVPIAEVRKLMREHDVYVMASNAYEGWGAVVSEALEEGMKVIGTYEAGASGTILPNQYLFHSNDVKALTQLLHKFARNELNGVCIGRWTAACAASMVKKICEE